MAATPPDVDVEAALDRLIHADAVDEADDGTLSTTAAFEETRRVYHDTYGDMAEAGFHRTVTALFDLDPDEVVATVPEGVAIAGVDGVAVDEFRQAFDVSTAPAVLLFRDGDLRQTLAGRQAPSDVDEAVQSVYR